MENEKYIDELKGLAREIIDSILQMNYITNVGAGQGLIKLQSSLIPFINQFPKNTKLYSLMTTKPGEKAS